MNEYQQQNMIDSIVIGILVVFLIFAIISLYYNTILLKRKLNEINTLKSQMEETILLFESTM